MTDWPTKSHSSPAAPAAWAWPSRAHWSRRKAKVVIAARTPRNSDTAAAELRAAGGEVLAVPADIRNRPTSTRCWPKRSSASAGWTCWSTMPAARRAGAAIDTTAEEFADLMDLNFTALVRCTRAAMPQLLPMKGTWSTSVRWPAKRPPATWAPIPPRSLPSALTRQQLRLELGPQGLHVLLVSPGPIARDKPRTYGAEKLDSLPASARKPGGGVKVKLIQPEWLAARIVQAMRAAPAGTGRARQSAAGVRHLAACRPTWAIG